MSRANTITGDQLTNALHVLGVHFVFGRQSKHEPLHKKPARLIASLAMSDDARLRLALIPLFLEHPEFAEYVHTVAKGLEPSARLTLQCYYSAAVWLGEMYRMHNHSLPDHFSKDLHLSPGDDPEKNLRALAKRHAELSGARVNWLGTYKHAAEVWHKALELQRR